MYNVAWCLLRWVVKKNFPKNDHFPEFFLRELQETKVIKGNIEDQGIKGYEG